MPRGAVPFPFGKCEVCCDQATGNHYGAFTCEGCKGFFKRSLQKFEKYKCPTQGNCQIEPGNRIKCKSCRFKRCLAAGMSMDAIKMGRIPKVEKQKALENSEQQNGVTAEKNNEAVACKALTSKDLPPEPKQKKIAENPRRDEFPSRPVLEPVQSNAFMAFEDYFDPDIRDQPYNSNQTAGVNQDMINLLSAAISFEEPEDVHNQHVHAQQHHPRGDSYARALASAADSINANHTVPHHGTEYNYWRTNHGYNGMHNQQHQGVPYNAYYDRPSHDHDPRPLQYSNYPSAESYQVNHQLFSQAQLHIGSAGIQPQYITLHPSHELPLRYDLPRPQTQTENTTKATAKTSGLQSINIGYSEKQIDPDNSHRELRSQVVASNLQRASSPSDNESGYLSHSDIKSDSDFSTGAASPSALSDASSVSAWDAMDDDVLIKKVALAYHDVTGNIREAIELMEERTVSKQDDYILEYKTENVPVTWSQIMTMVNHYNDMMLQFINKCPLILTVEPEDQLALIKHAYLAVWMIWNAPLFKKGDSYIIFPNGARYSRGWMEKILPPDFVQYIHDYCDRQNSSRFSYNELGIMTTLALTVPNVPGLISPVTVAQVHDRFQKALVYEVHKTRYNPKEILKEVPQLLEHLAIAVARQEIILNFNENQPPPINFVEDSKKTSQ